MEHEETLALIAVAAAEPDGLVRLMAGDTPESATVAGHLAGCATCVAELGAYARTAERVRDVVAAEPDPALRERTLAFVLARGEPRAATAEARDTEGPGIEAPDTGAPHDPATTAPQASPLPVPASLDPARRRPSFSAFVALAGVAAVIVAAVGGFLVGGAARAPQEGPATGEVGVLEETTRTLARLSAMPDAHSTALVAGDGGIATGSLVYSPTTGELVMFAEALPPTPDGAEYDCWMETGGQRQVIGELYPGGALLAWSGTAPALVGLADGATFGVTLRMPDGSQRVVLFSAG